MCRRFSQGLLLLGLTSACSVYAPLRPPTPLIDGPQQVEVGGGVSTSGGQFGAITYSPARHVLVRAALGGGPHTSGTDTSRYRARQLEAAVGTYWRPSAKVLLGGLLGYGRNSGEHYYQKRGGRRGALLGPRDDSTWTYRYQARYQYGFAEGYLHWFNQEPGLISMGLAYRVSYVRFGSYTNAGLPLRPRQVWRHEPTAFINLGADEGNGVDGWLSGQLAVGYSFSPLFTQPQQRAGNRDATEVRKPLPSFSVSLVLSPHELWQRRR